MFRDIQDVIEAAKAMDDIPQTPHDLKGKMNPRDFHKTIAVRGDEFYSSVRSKKSESQSRPSISSSTFTLPAPTTLPKPCVPTAFPKPTHLMTTKAQAPKDDINWRFEKQTSFLFENVISQSLDKEEPKSPLSLSVPQNRPRSRSTVKDETGSVDPDLVPTRPSRATQKRPQTQSVHLGTEVPITPLDTTDDDLVFDEEGIVLGGTPIKLLSLLTNLSLQNFLYITQFLSAYSSFLKAEDILEHLENELEAAHGNEEIEWLKRQRILFILTKWMKTHPFDFFSKSTVCAKLCGLLEKLNEPAAKDVYQKTIKGYTIPPPLSNSTSVEESEGFLMRYSPDHLAQQLCLADHKIFQKISAKELWEQKWVKANAASSSPTISRSIRHFNKISYWIATEIVKCCNLKDRIRVLKHAIHLAERCVVYRNYNTALAVVSGLSLAAIKRLKKTWKGLPAKYRVAFNELDCIFTAENNYTNYRELMVSHLPPMIPYLGVFLKDLTFLDIGNPSYLDSEKRLLNFDKLRMISSIITELRNFQEIPFQFETDQTAQQALHSLSSPFDEEQLYRISRIIEPPVVAKKDSPAGGRFIDKFRKRN